MDSSESRLRAQFSGDIIKSNEQTMESELLRNEVYWVNQNVQIPFDIKRGVSTNLGRMLTETSTSSNKLPLIVKQYHQRSAILGKVIFKDNQGQIYRDIDLKGTGLLLYEGKKKGMRLQSPGNKVVTENGKKKQRSQTGPWGLNDLGYAITDRDMSEKFNRQGIRTYRVLAIIRLLELLAEGNKLTLEEARERRIIRESDQPSIEVRAYATRTRVVDVAAHISRESEKALIQDAISLVANETGQEELEVKDYLNWFVQTMGQNIARMHRLGFVHKYLHPHNITLDARIIDLDSVREQKEMSQRQFNRLVNGDIKMAFFNITVMANLVRKSHSIPGSYPQYNKIFEKAYEDERNAKS